MMSKFARILIISFLLYLNLNAEVTLPSVFSDNMVFQRDTSAAIWGWASPGEKVVLRPGWTDKKYKAKTDKDGKWKTLIETPEDGGPFDIEIKGKNTIVLENILIGEVWLCSGQSNMDMWMTKGAGKDGVLNYKEEIAAANYPEIRLFKIGRKYSSIPLDNCNAEWLECSPESVEKFSGVAYYFGKRLHEDLDVPVGLIVSAYGGTRAEAWTSLEALQSDSVYQQDLNILSEMFADEKELKTLKKNYRKDLNNWFAESYYMDAKFWRPWISVEFDNSEWSVMNLPTKWEKAGLPGFTGTVWFRKWIELPESWQGRELVFDLGPVDDMDRTFFNGQRIGEIQDRGKYKVPRRYTISAELIAEKNLISIRVTDYAGSGGIYGGKDHLKIFPADDSTDVISVAGEWRYKVAYDIKDHRPIPRIPGKIYKNMATVLYNGMIAPVMPFTIKGVTWYQGETNRSNAHQYQYLFPLMIDDWRQRWQNPELPFYYVQIAPFDYHTKDPIAAEVRESQRLCLSIPHTGMVVTTDVGNVDDIHPRDKKTVGNRLADWALVKTYQFSDHEYSGPLYKKMNVEDGKVRIFFDYCEPGLIQKGDVLTDFTIADESGNLLPATAQIDGNTVLVWHPEVKNPVAVRFGWSNIAEPNLFNTAGLPASPFRTDNWKLTTQK